MGGNLKIRALTPLTLIANAFRFPSQPTARSMKTSEERGHRNERRIRGTGAGEEEGRRGVERSKNSGAEAGEKY